MLCSDAGTKMHLACFMKAVRRLLPTVKHIEEVFGGAELGPWNPFDTIFFVDFSSEYSKVSIIRNA